MSGPSAVETVVHPTDFGAGARAALPYAHYLAALLGVELRMLRAVAPGADGPAPGDFPSLDAGRGRVERWLGSAGPDDGDAPPASGGVEVRREVVRGEDAADAVLDRFSDLGASIVVMGTHGRGGLRRLVVGSVAERIVREAPWPVLTVRRGIEGWGDGGLRRITVGVDLSPMSVAALAWAATLAEAAGAALEVLHVVRSPAGAVAGGRRQRIDAAVRELEAPEVPHRVDVVGGDPADRLCRAAGREGADLVVTATHGRSGPSRLVLGSVAEAVIRRAECPVMTVSRPPRSGSDPEVGSTSSRSRSAVSG